MSFTILSAFDFAVRSGLGRLSSLKPNWDAEGAQPIDPKILDAAGELAAALPASLKTRAKAPSIVPMRKGNLQFEWHYGPKTLELEIENPSTIHYLKWNPAAGVEEEDVCAIADVDRIAALVEWFIEG